MLVSVRSLIPLHDILQMHAISDGERRRVQILLGLLEPFDLLLMYVG